VKKDHVRIDLVGGVLDHELLDARKKPCGRVVDLLIEYADDGVPRVTAVAVGSAARSRRLPRPLAALTQAWARRHERTPLPWSVVGDIGEDIRLTERAADLGLNGMEQRLARWLAKLPLGS
jgi:hypothetical protein